MLKGIKISKIAFIISFCFLFFFGLVTNIEAYCYCSGSSKVCYSGCEAYGNIRTCTTGCPGGLYCYDTNGTSWGVNCCDYKTTTNCSCGCSGGSCNTCCTPSTSCNCSPLSSSSTSYGSKTVTCSNGCGGTASSTCWCTGNCTPQSCPSGTSESGTHGTYATYSCTNECNKSNSRTCKCISACTPTSCPTGTTETNTGDSYSSYSCTNMCSESQTRNCYCSICTPPSCSSSGYSDTDLGCGQVSSALTPSCRNGQGAPDQLSKCDITYRTCYLPKYSITVSGNGGTCSPTSQSKCSGAASDAVTCTRAGYTFSGFSIISGSCGGSFNSSTGVCSKVTGSIEIKANWQCVPTSCNCSPLSSSSTSYGSKTVTCSDGCGGTASRTCWCTGNCTPQSCPSGTSESGTHGIYATYTCTNECNKSNSRTCKCTSACTPASCPSGTSESGTHGTYGTYSCINACNESNSRTCKCTSACTPTSCPTGTTETNTGDSYSSYSCTNACSESQTRNCYCSICTPPSCLSRGYSDTNLGYGQVPLEKTPSCRNGYNAPNYISKCDMTYRTCYCSSCLKQCPSPLANTGSANLILNDFRECTNDCDVKPPEDQDDCYEVPSDQPTESLTINGEEADPNEFGFLSLTHTGDNKNLPRQGDLNDPLSPIKIVATYTDKDGADDIEGMFVWFRESQNTGELGTPIYISETEIPQSLTNDSWGFMLRKKGTSDWDPYVPSYQEAQPSWTKAIYTTTFLGYRVFYISGPNSKQMVEVTILEQPLKEGDKVIMEFSLRFSNSEGILYNDPVAEGKYNIYLMGLDKFSFTPYDNYDIDYQGFWSEGFKYNGEENLSPFWQDNQLRYKQGQTYARSWVDTGQTWTIDRTGPYIEAFAFGTPDDNKLEVHWNVSDDRNLYAVVGNIYTTGGAFSRPVELLSNDPDNEIALLDPGSVLTFHNPNPFIPRSTAEADDIGKINGDWAFKVGPDSLASSSSHSIYIDVGENTTGLFDIHLTVFDDAGNFSTSRISINIADWFATGGGLAYSAEGTYFSTKNFVATEEGQPLPYPSENPGLQFGNSDYSSELWGEKNDENPEPLERSNETKSYNVTRYLGYKSTEGYYDYLKKEYEMNKKNIDNLEEVSPESPDLFGSLKGICNNQPYCMFEYTGDLNVKGDVICDNRSLIFVGGKLTIETPLKNTNDNQLSNKNGCIFVVKGDVTVQKGKNMSSTSLGYDIIHGYLLTDGQIIVEDETDKRLLPNTDPIIDGVYINGGLSSSYREGTGIIINRYLRVEEKLTYPVLVIDYHPKYGVIAEKFFGRKSTVKAVEIGVKP